MFDPSIGKERIFARAANHLRSYVLELDDIFRSIEAERVGVSASDRAGSYASHFTDRIKLVRDHIDTVVHGAAEAAAMTFKDGFWQVNPIDREHTFDARESIFALCRAGPSTAPGSEAKTADAE